MQINAHLQCIYHARGLRRRWRVYLGDCLLSFPGTAMNSAITNIEPSAITSFCSSKNERVERYIQRLTVTLGILKMVMSSLRRFLFAATVML